MKTLEADIQQVLKQWQEDYDNVLFVAANRPHENDRDEGYALGQESLALDHIIELQAIVDKHIL